MKITDKIDIFNEDCLPAMKKMQDNEHDLAIIDPPYGINASKMTMGTGKNKKWKKNQNWDLKKPDKNYFNELFRISKNQIVWGGNYFTIFYKYQKDGFFGIKVLMEIVLLLMVN